MDVFKLAIQSTPVIVALGSNGGSWFGSRWLEVRMHIHGKLGWKRDCQIKCTIIPWLLNRKTGLEAAISINIITYAPQRVCVLLIYSTKRFQNWNAKKGKEVNSTCTRPLQPNYMYYIQWVSWLPSFLPLPGVFFLPRWFLKDIEVSSNHQHSSWNMRFQLDSQQRLNFFLGNQSAVFGG